MINQAKFNAAVQPGSTPTMVFRGELIKYIQFVTMFRTILIILLLIVPQYSIY